MAIYGGQTIKILSWDKYNPKRDQQSYTWLRLNNDIATDPKLLDLSPKEKWAWVCMLCEASKKNDGNVFISYRWFNLVADLNEKETDKLLSYLINTEIVMIEVRDRLGDREMSPARPQDVASTTPTNERTNERDERTNSNAQCVFDFEVLYQKYPRKIGKQEGMKKCAKDVKTKEDYDSLSLAIDRFIQHHNGAKTDPKYLPYFSTFMTSWRDWLDPSTGSAENPGTEIDWGKVFGGDSAL